MESFHPAEWFRVKGSGGEAVDPPHAGREYLLLWAYLDLSAKSSDFDTHMWRNREFLWVR